MPVNRATKERIRQALSFGLVHSGFCAACRKVNTKFGAVILCGHRVAEDDGWHPRPLSPRHFADQIEYLTRHYEVLSLGELVQCFERGTPVPRDSVVLTFDDGYRDNWSEAFPVLKHHRVPATVFAVTGALDDGRLPWLQRLSYQLMHTSLRWLTHEVTGGERLPLTNPEVRERSWRSVLPIVARLSQTERERVLDSLTETTALEPPGDHMMTWDQAREMQAHGIEFGGHTVSHPWLAYVSREEARREIKGSRDALRYRLGIEHPHFAFPGGHKDEELMAMVKELGFRSAINTSARVRVNNLATTHRFALSRIGLPNAPATVLEAELDGPIDPLRRLIRRVGLRRRG